MKGEVCVEGGLRCEGRFFSFFTSHSKSQLQVETQKCVGKPNSQILRLQQFNRFSMLNVNYRVARQCGLLTFLKKGVL